MTMASKFYDKIYQNVIKQFQLNLEGEDLQKKIDNLHLKRNQVLGAMNLLVELYKEECGRNLQEDISNHPDFATLIKDAENFVSKSSDESVQSNEMLSKMQLVNKPDIDDDIEDDELNPIPQPAPPSDKIPGKKAHSGNKTIQQNPVGDDRRQPVKIVIDDSPAGQPQSGNDDD